MDKRTDDGGLCKPESAVARQLGTSGQLFREERVGAKASGNLCIQKMRGRATIGGRRFGEGGVGTGVKARVFVRSIGRGTGFGKLYRWPQIHCEV